MMLVAKLFLLAIFMLEGLYFLAKIYIRYRSKKWGNEIRDFTEGHDGAVHGMGDKRLLLIVNPASGGGKARKIFDECLSLLVTRGFVTEIYVTKGKDDVETLTGRKDFTAYDGFAVLSGDSSIYQLVQSTLREHGKWTYGPILHLPGGSSNVISGEMHSWANHVEIIEKFSLDNVKLGSAIKISSPDSSVDPRFAIHCCFHGMQRKLLEAMEHHRSGLYTAFGEFGLFLALFWSIFTIDQKEEPFFNVCVWITDVEAKKACMGFGLETCGDKMVVILIKKSEGVFGFFRMIFKCLSGKIANEAREGELPENMTVDIINRTVFQNHEFDFVCDGHSDSLHFKNKEVVLEVVPNIVPYCCL